MTNEKKIYVPDIDETMRQVKYITDKALENYASSIGVIAYGGSIAYGLANENSDIDLRGFYLPTMNDVLFMEDRGQIVINDDDIDATLYSAKKFIALLCSSNPNIMELLNIRREHIIVSSPAYEDILAHKDIFLSQNISGSFGGYAIQQLRRLENALLRDNADKVKAAAESAHRSMVSAIQHFASRYESYAVKKANISPTFVEHPNADENEPYLTVNMCLYDVPASELKGMTGDLADIVKNAENVQARNRKKDAKHLSKHMSHLIRLLRMGSEILESGEVNTYREDDREELLELKEGKWLTQNDDGTYDVDANYWELLDEEQKRFEYAKENTSLPKKPDMAAAEELTREIIRKYVVGI